MFNRIPRPGDPPVEIAPVTATITPAQLTGNTKNVYDELVAHIERNMSDPVAMQIMREVVAAFVAYLNNDPDYYDGIAAVQRELNVDLTSLTGTWANNPRNVFAFRFELFFPIEAFACFQSDWMQEEYFDCLFNLVGPLSGEHLEIPVEIPGPVRLTRPVAANWSDESFTVYWRPPAEDGGEITGYRIFRSQGNSRDNDRRPLDCDLPSFSYDRSFETYAFTVTVGQAGLYEYTMRPRGPSKTLGVTHGLCMRWHIAAVNSAGVGATVVTDPILSRGYVKSGQAYGLDDSRDGTACPAGQILPLHAH